ncbi:MAG TPA: ABC transporter substrate-binding protein [Jatrophihabitans sp.]|jgi:NitT/TauT family transport system substrate-binding protein|nr:ABC transporter substrate-binding protein [Jatrophihabitans sp.]
MSTTTSSTGAADLADPGSGAAGRSGRTVYQKRRRRRVLLVAAAIIVVAAVTTALLARSGGGSGPGFTVAYGQGNVASADSIIQTQPSISKTIKADLKFVPFDAGVTAIAELRSGSLQAISGVGNPPVVGAIGNGTDVVVVLAQSFDADALIVPAAITQPRQLAGTSVGVLVGSSEDFELRGWLKLSGLSDSVKVVGLASEQAVAAAYLSGALQGAYVQAGPEAQLLAKGGHAITNAQQIAKLGIPGLNVVAVAKDAIDKHPKVVQQYVCAQVQATRDFTGPQADKYLSESAKAQGVPGNLIVSATRAFPFIPLDQQLHWLGQPGDVNSPIVKAYAQTAQFLLGQGRIKTIPSNAVLATHIDSSFVQKALNGGC